MTTGPVDDGSTPSWRSVVRAGYERGQHLSAVGPGDVERHIAHADALADALDAPGEALDLGSGAGIPGLVLAGRWPESRWTLLDAARRRTVLLEAVVEELGWGARVSVIHGRAEDLGRSPDHRGRYDLVTARSFGPPAVTAECGAPLLRLGGVLAVSEPPDVPEDRWDPVGLEPLGLALLPARPGLQRLELVAEPEARFPRKAGIPAKRPLF